MSIIEFDNIRVQQKHETEAVWNSDPTFVPLSGEVIIYDADEQYLYKRFKVGDGTTPLIELPFSFKNSDWNQMNEKEPDYIKNKPNVITTLGGTIDGNLTVRGDITVLGTNISEDHETLLVEDNMVVLNSNKIDTNASLSGIAINKNTDSTYGAFYDPADDTFKFGEGTLDENNDFHFSENEGLPFAVRDDSSKFTDRHTIVWSEEGNKFVDSGYSILTQSDWNQTNTSHPAFIRNKPNTLTSLEHAVGKRVSGVDINGNTAYGEIFNDYDLNKISGAYGFACGTRTEAGTYSHATGYNAKATGTASSAEGYNNTSSGWASHSEGEQCKALGSKSHAEGAESIAEGSCSHAEGLETISKQSGTHTEGYQTYASGWYSHAEGQGSIAGGNHSHAEGIRSITFDEDGHAEGFETAAVGVQSHSEGVGISHNYYLTGDANSSTYTVRADDQSHIDMLEIGSLVKYVVSKDSIILAKVTSVDIENKKINLSKTLSASAVTDLSVKIYVAGVASGIYSHCEGYATNAKGSASHAEGYRTQASIGYSHAEGQRTKATNWEAHAQGKFTTASGIQSHAGGFGSEASGRRSFTHGYFTNAHKEDQFVIGRCNNVSEKALFIVGNGANAGSEEEPNLIKKNAFEVIDDAFEAAIKVGNTLITESQLAQLLELLNEKTGG